MLKAEFQKEELRPSELAKRVAGIRMSHMPPFIALSFLQGVTLLFLAATQNKGSCCL